MKRMSKMANNWQGLALLRNDRLLFEDTSGPPRPNSIVPCLLCTKPFWMGIFIGEPDQVCPECKQTYADAARIICAKCKITIARARPKVLENGFYVRPRAVLHSDACNICKPGLRESIITEIDEWERTRRPGRIIVPMKMK